MPIYQYPIDGKQTQFESTPHFYERQIDAIERQIKWEQERIPTHQPSVCELVEKLEEYREKLAIAKNRTISFDKLLKMHSLEDASISRAYDIDETKLMPWEDKEEDYGPYHDDGTEADDLENDEIIFDETEIDAVLEPTMVEIEYDNPNKTYSVYMHRRESCFDRSRIASWIRFAVYKKEQPEPELEANA
jgi:hypothetical protein